MVIMKAAIEQFFSSATFAVVGVSRSRHKFGNTVFRTMKRLGCTVYPVNAHLATFDGVRCYSGVGNLPEDVDAAVLVVHPEDALRAVGQCMLKGINNIWLQPGAQSDDALRVGSEHGLNIVHGHCILMFVEPVRSIHALHRWGSRLVGTYPR